MLSAGNNKDVGAQYKGDMQKQPLSDICSVEKVTDGSVSLNLLRP